MDEPEKELLPDTADHEDGIPGTYPSSSTSVVSRRRPFIAIIAFLVFSIVFAITLTSALSGLFGHGASNPNPYLRELLGQSISDWLGIFSNDGYYSSGPWNNVRGDWPGYRTKPSACPVPLPNLLKHQPLKPGNITASVQEALDSLNAFLVFQTYQNPDVDSLAVAIVTPAGTIFERGHGILKANDTSAKQYPVDRHSIYRIASISKMFTVFETLLLRERGVLDLDDPVEKYIPEFKPPSADLDWPEYLHGRESDLEDEGYYSGRSSRITLRQLASHTGGLGRDYPVQNLTEWPVKPEDYPETPNGRKSSRNAVLEGTSGYPLVNLPYSYPMYSNAGFDLLGLANVAANLKAKGDLANDEPQTHKDLVKRDIFDVFDLNSSFFRLPEEQDLRDHIAIPAKYPKWADSSFGDADDSAGGQYSSLADLAKMAQVFLSPKPPNKQHRFLPALMREWLRPVHIWPNGQEAVGAPWEIDYHRTGIHELDDCFDGECGFNHGMLDYSMHSGMHPPSPVRVPIYSKSGSLPGYRSLFSLNPEYGYGVVVLATGANPKPAEIVNEAIRLLQPPLEQLLLSQVNEAYAGTWEADRRGSLKDVAAVEVLDGQLFLTKLVVDGIDVLKGLRVAAGTAETTERRHGMLNHGLCTRGRDQTRPVALWSTGRLHEFRVSPGPVPTHGDVGMASCVSYWATIDYPRVFARGASVGLVYWENGELVYPSAGVRFKRTLSTPPNTGCRCRGDDEDYPGILQERFW